MFQSRTTRPLPATFASRVQLPVFADSFYDQRQDCTRQQWTARYAPEGAKRLDEFIKVVINYRYDEPTDGDIWELELLYLAPKANIVFARPVRLIATTAMRQQERQAAEAKRAEAGDAEHQRCWAVVQHWMAEETERKLRTLCEHFAR